MKNTFKEGNNTDPNTCKYFMNADVYVAVNLFLLYSLWRHAGGQC